MEKEGKRAIKYLSVEDFNALMASKLESWADYAKKEFEDALGKDFSGLKDK